MPHYKVSLWSKRLYHDQMLIQSIDDGKSFKSHLDNQEKDTTRGICTEENS